METQEYSAGIRYATATVSDRKAFLAALHAISDRYGTHIVCFDADNLAGRQHAEKAVRFARRAIAERTAISHSFEMEALLYVCCCPDIPAAWQELTSCMKFIPEPADGITAKKAARLSALFDITQEEIVAAGGDGRLEELVLERVALLEVSK